MSNLADLIKLTVLWSVQLQYMLLSLPKKVAVFQSQGYLQVSWSGVANATEADVIALFVPANQSVDTIVPVKYKWVNRVANWEQGSGSFL